MTTNKLFSNIIKKSFSIIISIFSLFSYSQKISNEKLFESKKIGYIVHTETLLMDLKEFQ
jgi:hypothetical protein